MASIPWTGPVFEFEWLTASRRWQLYAMRSVFIAALLFALGMAWGWSTGPQAANITQAQAQLAKGAYLAIVGTQLALVLLVAPAATAGSICIDRARGTLAHVLVTDLTDSEIVLGKLASRLLPVLGLIGCTLPVVAICTLLGGIDPVALTRSYAVTAALGILGCSLALTLSIWARKTHEALMATYLIVVGWLLVQPSSWLLRWVPGSQVLHEVLTYIDPIDVTFGAFGPSFGPTDVLRVAVFCLICLGASAALLVVAVRRLREVTLREQGRAFLPKRKKPDSRSSAGEIWWRWLDRLPGPSLDSNPVLWREWHRNRPSRWSQRLWTVYFASTAFFSLIALMSDLGSAPGRPAGRACLFVTGFAVAIGILLLSVGASTSLAEERARGSLDVLMTTPLSTRSIVWGKWLGGFRVILALAFLPTLVATILAERSGFWQAVPLLVLQIVAYGAFFTSLGLALATWVPRLGRAVAICVAVDVLVTVGLFFLILVMVGPRGERMLSVCPFGGPAILTAIAGGEGGPSYPDRITGSTTALQFVVSHGYEITGIAAYLFGAAILLHATFRTFDACLGRAREVPQGIAPRRVFARVGEPAGSTR